MLKHASIVLAAALAGACAVAICFSFLSAYLPVADSVAHFRLHLTVALLGWAAALAVFWARRLALFAVGIAAAGLAGLGPALPHWQPAASQLGARAVKVVQINLLYKNRDLQQVVDFIRREDPDFVTLQEVTSRTRRVISALAKDYPHRIQCRTYRVGDVAVLSRFPKAPGRSSGCIHREGVTWLRVDVHGRPISVASIHLHWPYPYRQPKQVEQLEAELAKIPRPIIVGGDFNAAPWSQSVDRIARATDTTVVPGLRLSLVKPMSRWGPTLRLPIDHVLKPEGLRTIEATLGPSVGSDHLPVIVKFSLN